MDTIEIQRDAEPDIRFAGKRVANASSFKHHGPSNQRWTELTLYRTASGKWVCQIVGRTERTNERTRYSAVIAEDDATLIAALGHGWLSKRLYDKAGIDHAVIIV